MQNRFTLFKRGKIFYCEDRATGQQKSLQTRDESEAQKIVQAKNDVVTLPQMNLVMAMARLYKKMDPAGYKFKDSKKLKEKDFVKVEYLDWVRWRGLFQKCPKRKTA